MAAQKLPTNESRFFVGKENVITRWVDYLIAILCLQAGEDLKHLHFLSCSNGFIVL